MLLYKCAVFWKGKKKDTANLRFVIGIFPFPGIFLFIEQDKPLGCKQGFKIKYSKYRKLFYKLEVFLPQIFRNIRKNSSSDQKIIYLPNNCTFHAPDLISSFT